MLKKITSILLIGLSAIALASCGGSDENTGDTASGTTPMDELKFDDLDYLPEYSTKRDLNLKNDKTGKKDKTAKVDYKAKKYLEDYILNYLVNFGIYEFELPLATDYPSEDDIEIFGLSLTGISGIITNHVSYEEYLKKTFRDWTDTTIGGIISYSYFVNEHKYSISFMWTSEDWTGLNVTLSGKLEDWDALAINHENYENRYTLNLPKNVKIDYTVEGQDYTSYLLEDQCLIEDANDKYYYNKIGNYYEKVEVNRNDILQNETEKTIEADDYMLHSELATNSSYMQDALAYISLMNRDLVARYSWSENNPYEGKYYYFTLGIMSYLSACTFQSPEYINGRRCFVVTSKNAYKAENYVPTFKLWADCATGLVLRIDVNKNNTLETYYSANLTFGDFEIAVNDTEDGKKISVNETVDNNNYTVNIYKGTTKLATKTVKAHNSLDVSDITLPNDFIGWNGEIYDITKNGDVYMDCASNYQYTVTFKDSLGQTLKTEKVNKYADATYPDAPKKAGYNIIGWDVMPKKVQKNMTVTLQYEKIAEYTVNFYDNDCKLLKTEKVLEGNDATPPTAPEISGYTFEGWSPSYEKITADTDVFTVYSLNNAGTFGSVGYYIQKINHDIENLSEEDKLKYFFELSDELALASMSDEYCDALLNSGKALTVVFPHPQILNNYGILLINTGHKQTAVPYLECAVEKDGFNYLFLTNLAQLVFEDEFSDSSSNYEATLDLVDLAIEQNPEYGPALQLKSEVMLCLGKPKEALSYLIDSARYTFNQNTILEFSLLYTYIDEEYRDLCDESEDFEEVIQKWNNPLGEYIPDLMEIACQNGQECSMVSQFDYQANMSSEQCGGFNYASYCQKMENELEQLKDTFDYNQVQSYVEYFEDGAPASTKKNLSDIRQYTMFSLIQQYYEFEFEKMYYLANKELKDANKTAYDNTVEAINAYAEQRGKDISELYEEALSCWANLLVGIETGSDDNLTRALNISKEMEAKYKDGIGVIEYIYGIQEEIGVYIVNQWNAYGNKALPKVDEIYSKAFSPVVEDYYDNILLILRNLSDKDLFNYIYMKADEMVVNSYEEFYGAVHEVSVDVVNGRLVGELYIVVAKQILKEAYEKKDAREYEAAQPRPEAGPLGPPKLSLVLQCKSDALNIGVSMEVTNDLNEVSFGFDTPLLSYSIGFDLKNQTNTATTVTYGILSTAANSYNPLKEITAASYTVGYGRSVTRDAYANVTNITDFKQVTYSVDVDNIGYERQGVYNFDVISGEYVYASSSFKANFKYVGLKVGN